MTFSRFWKINGCKVNPFITNWCKLHSNIVILADWMEYIQKWKKIFTNPEILKMRFLPKTSYMKIFMTFVFLPLLQITPTTAWHELSCIRCINLLALTYHIIRILEVFLSDKISYRKKPYCKSSCKFFVSTNLKNFSEWSLVILN